MEIVGKLSGRPSCSLELLSMGDWKSMFEPTRVTESLPWWVLLGTGVIGNSIKVAKKHQFESAGDVDGRLHAGDRVLALVLEVRVHLQVRRQLQHSSNPKRFESRDGNRSENVWDSKLWGSHERGTVGRMSGSPSCGAATR